ncbi:MAG: UPF0182 family protein, partial [Spirochaetales bacterium]|nr:UPF0182 family protein [Spirochaetales bacterium]
MFILFEVALVLVICIPLIRIPGRLRTDGEAGRKKAKRRRIYKAIIAIIFFVVIAWNIYLSTYVNWFWFESKGYLEVFRKILGLKWMMFGTAFFISFVFIFINLKVAFGKLRENSSKTNTILLWSFFIALIMGGVMSGLWSIRMLNKYQVVSDITDPVFGRSISYYLFSLPWKAGLLAWVQRLFVIPFLILSGWVLSDRILHRILKRHRKRIEVNSYKSIIRQLFIL